MIKVKKEGILLSKANLEFENGTILNPAIVCETDNDHKYYGAMQKGNNSGIGYNRIQGPQTEVEQRERSFTDSESGTKLQNTEFHWMADAAYNQTNQVPKLLINIIENEK